MTDFEIIEHYSNGFTAKEIAALCEVKCRAIEHRLRLMHKKYNATTTAHLVAIFLRRGIIQ